jgi:hypothetical protein
MGNLVAGSDVRPIYPWPLGWAVCHSHGPVPRNSINFV